jgi:hypothetical protein
VLCISLRFSVCNKVFFFFFFFVTHLTLSSSLLGYIKSCWHLSVSSNNSYLHSNEQLHCCSKRLKIRLSLSQIGRVEFRITLCFIVCVVEKRSFVKNVIHTDVGHLLFQERNQFTMLLLRILWEVKKSESLFVFLWDIRIFSWLVFGKNNVSWKCKKFLCSPDLWFS